MRIEPSAKRALWFVLCTLLSLAALGFLFLWSGVYSVAASRGHFAVTEWLLTFVMRNSVKTHSLGIEGPPLDDIDLIALGAGHFHNGCAFCHGAPGIEISPIARGMLPPPPDLKTGMREWRDSELFWIVKSGIKYTGMPAWAAQHRDDEVWALVAFLRRLASLDAQGYRDLALGDLRVAPQSGRDVATSETASAAVGACGRCHGAERTAPSSALVPILQGQPAEFLLAALEAYAQGGRASGIMQPVAADLTRDEMTRVAHYYAGLRPPAVQSTAADASAVERGRTLAERGDPVSKTPACRDCHSANSLAIYPRLAGQSQRYMANRLRLWKGGLAPGTGGEEIMAPIARTLSDAQIGDLAAYYASAATAR